MPSRSSRRIVPTGRGRSCNREVRFVAILLSWIDILGVVAFSLAIYSLAVSISEAPEYVEAAVPAEREAEPFDAGLVTS